MRRQLTLTLVVDIKLRRRGRRLADPVVCDAFDGIVVVPGRLDRLNPQHGPVRHVQRRVALSAGRHAASALPPVDFRRRVARRLAEEADDAVVGYSLVARCHRHLGRVYDTTDHTRRSQSYATGAVIFVAIVPDYDRRLISIFVFSRKAASIFCL